MKKNAVLACLLLPLAAFAQTPTGSAGSETAPTATSAQPTAEPESQPGAEVQQPQAQAQPQAQPAAPPEMTPEAAAQAAAEGKLQYAKEMTNPNEATAAEIAAHNATAAPDDRITCKRVKPTGSNRPMKFCSTAKQRREMREASQNAMDASNIDDIGRRNPGKLETLGGR